ncbi:MAG: hypothetical protein OXB91_07425 [Bryobacterales bacterium]|nr:hypothetical protein [Bryobacterales bacterium]
MNWTDLAGLAVEFSKGFAYSMCGLLPTYPVLYWLSGRLGIRRCQTKR